MLVFTIHEGNFSYMYKAEYRLGAIQQWLSATFIAGCVATEPTDDGHFVVRCPSGREVKARIQLGGR